ncbi:protein ABCI12, chloroplastic-like [Lycium ferocissimum]|uniref:protein ABCI12, chloroplastic-like n=1 Tax=Lycium ferocissimum TaxID=112874 RepID=UPI002815F0F5|nr:protein ABCI12, chloroplastic-like [Lycium ferocissimum]
MLENSLVDCLIWLQDQLGGVALLSGILFIMLGLSTDRAPSLISSRAPPPSMGLPPFPASLEGYKYVILKLWPLQLTRKGLSTATTSACLTFTFSSHIFVGYLEIFLFTQSRYLRQ